MKVALRQIPQLDLIRQSALRGEHFEVRKDTVLWREISERGWIFECPDLPPGDLLRIRRPLVLRRRKCRLQIVNQLLKLNHPLLGTFDNSHVGSLERASILASPNHF